MSFIWRTTIVLFHIICRHSLICLNRDFTVVKQWSYIEFSNEDHANHADIFQHNEYMPIAVPIDLDVHYEKDGSYRIFVTLPRMHDGVTATLGVVEEDGCVTPYPSFSWHKDEGLHCDSISSVYRIAIDECNRIWVLDSSKSEENNFMTCPPQLLAFDLRNDQMVYRYKFPDKQIRDTSLLSNLVVDVRHPKSRCRDTFVYVADSGSFALLVIDVRENKSWRIKHRLFYPFPSQGTFRVEGYKFDMMYGILGMALSPLDKHQHDRILYFHSPASVTENYVHTSIIRNSMYVERSAHPLSMQVYRNKRKSRSLAEAMDDRGIMYFGSLNPPAIQCWNSATEYGHQNIHTLTGSKKILNFATGVKVVTNSRGGQELWILTSKFLKFVGGSLNGRKVNYRILAANISNILMTSRCNDTT